MSMNFGQISVSRVQAMVTTASLRRHLHNADEGRFVFYVSRSELCASYPSTAQDDLHNCSVSVCHQTHSARRRGAGSLDPSRSSSFGSAGLVLDGLGDVRALDA